MRHSIRALLSCLIALVVTTTSFATSVSASPLHVFPLYSVQSTEIAFINSATTMKAGKVILRVAPKVAEKLVKKYGIKIVKILPATGTAMTVLEISVDVYNLIQQELAQDSELVS